LLLSLSRSLSLEGLCGKQLLTAVFPKHTLRGRRETRTCLCVELWSGPCWQGLAEELSCTAVLAASFHSSDQAKDTTLIQWNQGGHSTASYEREVNAWAHAESSSQAHGRLCWVAFCGMMHFLSPSAFQRYLSM
jgi:hypothetical protein